MEGSSEQTFAREKIWKEDQVVVNSIGPTTVEYKSNELEQYFITLASDRITPAEAEDLATKTQIYFDHRSFFSNIIKTHSLAEGNATVESLKALFTKRGLSDTVHGIADIISATELVYPDKKNPSIMINLDQINKYMNQQHVPPERRSIVTKAILGEALTTGYNELIVLQDEGYKQRKAIQSAGKKMGVASVVVAANFAAGIVPIPLFPLVNPLITNVVLNGLKPSIHPKSNEASKLFEVSHKPNEANSSPLPLFFQLQRG